jgi:hypothetical protein
MLNKGCVVRSIICQKSVKGALFFIATCSLNAISADDSKSGQNRSWSIYSEIDYLLWYATQDGLSYTTVANTSFPITNQTSLKEVDHFLNPGWRSGARGVIGLQFPHWDTNLSYTFYYTKAEDSSKAESQSIPSSASSTSAGTIIFDDPSYQLFDQFPGELTGSASANWRLNFNRLDWEFGRKLQFGSHFMLRPFLGLEGLITTQKLHENTNIYYQSLDTGLPVLDIVKSKDKGRFMALGARAGFSTEIDLGLGFDLYGNIAGSILWGFFKIKQSLTQTDQYATGETTLLGKESLDHSHHASIFNFDIGIGIDWKYKFQKSLRELGLKFGWEQHIFTDINRFQNFYLTEVSSDGAVYSFDRNMQKGNLALSGFTFGLSFLY